MNLISSLKKTVTSLHELLDPVGLDREKPRFLYLPDQDTMLDPAGNPRTNVYRRDLNTGSGPTQ